MSLKDNFRSLIPSGVWQTLGFCKRLPVYWQLDRSESLRVRNRIEGLPIFVTPEIFVMIPESITAYICWESHAIVDTASSIETTDFLELAKGRSAFIDIGAQTGFMSALFARSRTGPTQILSLEPDPLVHAVLGRAMELNRSQNTNWTILHEAVSNVSGTISMPISNTVYESGTRQSQVGKLIQVPSRRLNELVESLGWTPDIIKIDVESFEFEILTTSMEVLAKVKPALQLEVHWEILKQRGLDASRFLKPLADLGYRGIRKKYRGLAEWQRAGGRETVSRLALH
jgi:FkbM family methyltransferase